VPIERRIEGDAESPNPFIVRAVTVIMPVILPSVCRLVDPGLCIHRLRDRVKQACPEESFGLDLAV